MVFSGVVNYMEMICRETKITFIPMAHLSAVYKQTVFWLLLPAVSLIWEAPLSNGFGDQLDRN